MQFSETIPRSNVWVNFLDFSLYHNKASNSSDFSYKQTSMKIVFSAAKFLNYRQQYSSARKALKIFLAQWFIVTRNSSRKNFILKGLLDFHVYFALKLCCSVPNQCFLLERFMHYELKHTSPNLKYLANKRFFMYKYIHS